MCVKESSSLPLEFYDKVKPLIEASKEGVEIVNDEPPDEVSLLEEYRKRRLSAINHSNASTEPSPEYVDLLCAFWAIFIQNHSRASQNVLISIFRKEIVGGGDVPNRLNKTCLLIPKKSNKFRLIHVPSVKLKTIHHILSELYLNKLPVHPCSLGFQKGVDGIKLHASNHQNKYILYHFDLKDFYHQITRKRVDGYLKLFDVGKLNISGYVTKPCDLYDYLTREDHLTKSEMILGSMCHQFFVKFQWPQSWLDLNRNLKNPTAVEEILFNPSIDQSIKSDFIAAFKSARRCVKGLNFSILFLDDKRIITSLEFKTLVKILALREKYLAKGCAINDLYSCKERSSFLPQGWPCSPLIANICSYNLDSRLNGFAVSKGGTYSRYADDLVLSFPTKESDPGFNAVKGMVGLICEEEGFELNDKKTRVQKKYSQQLVTGVVVNEKMNIPKKYYGAIREVLVAANKNKYRLPAEELRSIEGKIQWVKKWSNHKGVKLEELFSKQID